MLRFPTLILALMLGLPLAHAGMLPVYDAEAICSDLAGTSAKQEVVMRGCLDFQERMRKDVALTWDGLPGSVQELLRQGGRGERRLLAAQILHRPGGAGHFRRPAGTLAP